MAKAPKTGLVILFAAVLTTEEKYSLSDSNIGWSLWVFSDCTLKVISGHQAKIKPREMEEMKSAILGMVSYGLQHEVIAITSCCKGGGQKGYNCHCQTYTGTTDITILRCGLVVACTGHCCFSISCA